jgi:GTP-binding protein YchF
MSLKCGILGLPNVGKSTLFNSISTGKAEAANFPFCTIEPNLGVVTVPDERIDKLSEIVNPQKTIPTTINFVDIAGLVKGASKGEGLGNKFLSNLKEVDLLIHVIRCFENDNIVHVNGKIDPVSDKEIIDYELIIKDLDSVDRRIDKIRKQAITGDKEKKTENDILIKCKSHLEDGISLRELSLDNNEVKWIKHLNLITLKPLVYVANIDESLISSDNEHINNLREIVNKEGLILIKICASLEEQLYDLTEEEKNLFLDDYGITESGLDMLIKASYKSLDLITYFTAGEKEVRAWTVKKDSTAPQAAGVIHTDFEKGFIKAEVIKYNDFISYGSELKCKEAGKLSIEGKEYILSDGDVMHFRFNV